METNLCAETAGFLSAARSTPAVHLYAGPRVTLTFVLVPPLLEERKSCLQTLVATGRRLTELDAAILRIDFSGCGNSPATLTDFSLSDWLSDLSAAAITMRQLYPQAPQIWLGVRTGALLALQLATRTDCVRPEALILWEPVLGPDFVRQILQRRQVNEMLAYGQARLGRQAAEAQLSAGGAVDCDGFAISGQLYRELQALQPTTWQGPGLIISTGPDSRASDTCHSLAPATVRRHIRLPPFWQTVGHVDTTALTEATFAWVASHGPNTVMPSHQAAPQGPATTLHASGQAASLPQAVLTPATPDCRERMVSFAGSAGGMLRGVLHIPATPSCGRIIFLHGWSGDRTGPHRMFVQAARSFANLGFTCLRFDFRGRGDSDSIPDQAASIGSMTEDARAAISWLQTAVPAGGPIILLAICSGSKVAISTAAVEPAVARLALWSAESMGSLRHAATSNRKRLDVLLAYARKLLLPDTWRKLLRGQVRAGMVGKALVAAEVRSPAEARAEDITLRAFRSFPGDILFVFGGSDPDAPGSAQAYTQYCREHGITHTCHTIPHAGHSYYSLAWEQEVLQITQTWLGGCRHAAWRNQTAKSDSLLEQVQ